MVNYKVYITQRNATQRNAIIILIASFCIAIKNILKIHSITLNILKKRLYIILS